jgi:hypothetical protein
MLSVMQRVDKAANGALQEDCDLPLEWMYSSLYIILYHDLNCLGHKTRFLGILPVFLGSKRHFCADSLPLVGKNVAQN